VTRFTLDGKKINTYELPEGRISIGTGVDHEGKIWAINGNGLASRIDPETDKIDEFPVGAEPYTYSDFTGYALRRIIAPSGYLRVIVQGCSVGSTE
jgi:sugar lactone lactonase YvrE